jgi:sugar/nucleoside kinase (ribokinase family)
MPDAGRVISLCSILIDQAVEVPGIPERGGGMLATGARTQVGGGFNLVAAVARQGIECVYAGVHGTGRNGDMIRTALADEGVRLALQPRSAVDSGFCIAMIEPDGQPSFITMPGVESTLVAADLAGLDVRASDVIAISGYDLLYPVSGVTISRWLASSDWSAGTGPRVLLDPGPLLMEIPAAILDSVLASVDLLTLNQREARLFAQADDLAGADLVQAVRRGGRVHPATTVVVREGARGCCASGGAAGDEVMHVAAPRVAAVDTTGAGDAHSGVLASELLRGSRLADALLTANRAAAHSVTRSGPATAPTRAELQQFAHALVGWVGLEPTTTGL